MAHNNEDPMTNKKRKLKRFCQNKKVSTLGGCEVGEDRWPTGCPEQQIVGREDVLPDPEKK